jgi:carbon storage regulator
MLILTRRLREVLRVGDDIKVHVLGMKGGQIRLGVEAPKDVPVHREEVWVRIHHEAQRPVAAAEEPELAEERAGPA